MRFLTQQWNVPLEKVVVLASQAEEPDGDRAELLSGLVSSVLVGGAPPPSPRTASREQAPPGLTVSTDSVAVAAAHINRTTWLDTEEELGAALAAALASKEE